MKDQCDETSSISQDRMSAVRDVYSSVVAHAQAVSFLDYSSVPGAQFKSLDQSIRSGSIGNLSFDQGHKQFHAARKARIVQAGYSDGGRSNGGSLFIGGFVLGGIVVGTLGCIYASKITETLAGVDRKQIMKRLPKFIYDEEKDLERKRRILEEKIEQLNATLDGVAPPRSRSRHDMDAEFDEFSI